MRPPSQEPDALARDAATLMHIRRRLIKSPLLTEAERASADQDICRVADVLVRRSREKAPVPVPMHVTSKKKPQPRASGAKGA